MKQYTFSIITPVFVANEQRAKELHRAIWSIRKQTYSKELVEYIIVNDGSPFPFEIPDSPWIKVINQPNLQRMTAYERGFKEAKNEIVCLLDSDDKYIGTYLEDVNRMFNDVPEYSMVNFGSIHTWNDKSETERDPFQPSEHAIGHEVFGGGNIVNGTFAFKKAVYDDLGGFPPPIIKDIDCTAINYPHHGEMIRNLYMTSPYDFSAYAQLEFPEIREFFMVDVESEPHKVVKELGNPFGNDFYLFYKYTRKYKCKPFKEYLYHVYHHEGSN